MKSSAMRLLILLSGLFVLASCGGGGGGTGKTGNTPTARISWSTNSRISTDTGAAVSLDSAGSSDPQGLPLTYTWTIGSKPAGSTTRIDGAGQSKAEMEADVAGTYVVQLVVNNGIATSQPAVETITVTGAATGWKRMGEVLDIDYSQNAMNPYLAVDSSGSPVVAWEETDPNAASMKNIYVKKWNGSSWTQLGGALDINIADDVYQPVVAIDPTDGNPVVLWEEESGARKVFVKKWNGSSWTQLGNALNTDVTKDAFTRPSIATSSSGTIYAAWEEFTPDKPFVGDVSSVFVAQWTGTAWSLMGSYLSSDYINRNPVLAVDPASGYPVLAWSSGEEVSTAFFGHMVCVKWNGSSWTGIGQTNFDGAISAVDTTIAIGSDSLPIVGWSDESVIANHVLVKKYDGASSFGGGYMSPSPGYNAVSPWVLADPADNQPILAFTAENMFVKKWDTGTSAWIQYGSRVNYWSTEGAPIIAYGPSGKIIVTLQDVVNSKNVYVKIQQ